ncbi:uncharacterized protein J4E88_005729 [Alternaria novae-zelandiae]|uniref:uncharacterized protein n=1 Tax=Alternaria novae-zelandiae TaxID=430562 RepID=UPI0020C31408|nr:uncharacterized protein J4E88_005729 [Alternaria novae-zelandiae]KAI4681222.1 hypothetical protein J4E88_005729 [Alternaria novae-zelandiae]
MPIPAFHHVRSPVNHEAWAAEPEHVWRPSYPDLPTWGSQQFSLPYHGGPACEQMSLQPVQQYVPHSGPSVAPAYIPYHAPAPFTTARVANPGPLKKELPSDAGHSDKESDSESEDSESDDEASLHGSSYSSSRRSGANANVMKLGKWGENPASYPLHHTLDTTRIILESHALKDSNDRNTFDATSGLSMAMTGAISAKGDNLRDHYWTHVNRGGRAGKNNKMSIPELKAILGPKERPLIRRLKMKLNLLKERNMRAKL